MYKGGTMTIRYSMNLLLVAVGILLFGGCATVAIRDTNPTTIEQVFILADSSSSMGELQKLSEEVTFLQRFVEEMPDGRYLAAFYSFNSKTLELQKLRTFNRRSIMGKAPKLMHFGGDTKLEDALALVRTNLENRTGKTAVVILSDGLSLNEMKVYFATNALVENYPDTICFHTVLFGSDPRGYGCLNKISQTTDCGSHRLATLVSNKELMRDFVHEVFFGRLSPDTVTSEESPVLDSDGDGVPDARDECPNTPKGARVDERGCWVIDNVLFELDKAVLRPAFYPVLDEVVSVLNQNPEIHVRIDGHTCSRGSDNYNLNLSIRRANAVRNYLIDMGVSADRLTVKGFGESQPILPNDSEANMSRNRRVEITVME